MSAAPRMFTFKPLTGQELPMVHAWLQRPPDSALAQSYASKTVRIVVAQAPGTAQGSEVTSGSPEQFADFIEAEIAKIGKIAKAAGIKAE